MECYPLPVIQTPETMEEVEMEEAAEEQLLREAAEKPDGYEGVSG